MSVEAEKSDLDTEQFIVEIQSRPALWDLNNDDYCNRDLKKKHWEELVTIYFKKEEASAAEKSEFGKQLQRKWKSLRDCYTRERQRLAKIKSGSSVPRKTQYVFYNQLSFLQTVIRGKDTSDNMEEVAAAERPPDSEQPSTSSDVQSVEVGRGERKKVDSKISSEVECLVNVLQTGMQSREKRLEEDDDRLFLLSLMNPLKTIPQHLSFGVRMQIMQLINNTTQQDVSYNLNPHQHQYPQPNFEVNIDRPSEEHGNGNCKPRSTSVSADGLVHKEVSSPPDVKSDAGTLYIDDLDDPLIRPSSVSSCQAPVKSVGGKKRGRQDACDNLLALIGKRLQSSRTEDEFDIVGKNLSNKLRRLCRKQQLFAERLMNEVVFEGELGNLNRSSKIVVQPESKDSVKELQNTPAPSSNASR